MRLSLVFLPLFCASLGAQTTASHLFLEHEPLNLTLETDLHALRGDRGKERKAHPGTLRYGTGRDTASIAVTLRPRGIFRLKICACPPIRLDLPSHKVEVTPFAEDDKV